MTPDSPAPSDGLDPRALDVDAVRDDTLVPATPADEHRERARQSAADLVGLVGPGAQVAEDARERIDSLGRDLQLEATRQSQLLLGPVRDLGEHGAEGGAVAQGLIDLRMQVESLDPADLEFSPGWPERLLGFIPGIGNPLKRYFAKYQTAQTTIDSIIKSLEGGRDQLRRDNVTLADDQAGMRETARQLSGQVAFAQALDAELDEHVRASEGQSNGLTEAIQQSLQFPLRQRVIDLQQQLAVAQQGIVASEIVIRNNRELMRGVDRAVSVTTSALRTAVSVAFALAHQRIVLDKIEAVNQTTSSIISGTAERLRTQGTEIQARAASSQLDMEHLKAAFADVRTALDDLSNYRRDALPQLSETIAQLNQMTGEAARRIADLGSVEIEGSAPDA